MSIEMKITAADPAELASQIKGLHAMLYIGNLQAKPLADAPKNVPADEGVVLVAKPGQTPNRDEPAEPVAEAPRPRGRPRKEALVIEAKVETVQQPEVQLDVEGVDTIEVKEATSDDVQTAILRLGNTARVKAAPDAKEPMKAAVGAAYQALNDAGVARGEPALPEFKRSAVPPARYGEMVALCDAATAKLEAA